ncbi:MAG: hypothetical protein [Microviridae sp.]|nr:MAG: hypothetical protein [Microviridae sp.]
MDYVKRINRYFNEANDRNGAAVFTSYYLANSVRSLMLESLASRSLPCPLFRVVKVDDGFVILNSSSASLVTLYFLRCVFPCLR